MKQLVDTFIAALNKEMVCLHPTDTLPGLTFHPLKEKAIQKIYQFKKERNQKPFVSLASDINSALSFFKPLPSNWHKVLEKIWPAPLSVIWEANDQCPAILKANDNTTAIRVPILPKEAQWLYEVMSDIKLPLPTTSANRSGETPAKSIKAARDILQNEPHFFLPDIKESEEKDPLQKPSTLIRIYEDMSYTVIREGAFSIEKLEAEIKRVLNNA